MCVCACVCIKQGMEYCCAGTSRRQALLKKKLKLKKKTGDGILLCGDEQAQALHDAAAVGAVKDGLPPQVPVECVLLL